MEKETIMASLGFLIQQHRKSADLTVEDLAEKVELSVGTIRAYEQGRRMPSVEAVKNIISVLAIPGTWVSPQVWEAQDGSRYTLAAFAGDNTIGKVRSESEKDSELRLRLVQNVLSADRERLMAIDVLLNAN